MQRKMAKLKMDIIVVDDDDDVADNENVDEKATDGLRSTSPMMSETYLRLIVPTLLSRS